MSRIPNRESGLEWARMQFQRAIIYAQWWTASASNGHAVQRQISRGREPTEEERARGKVVGWNPLSDQEKIADAMSTAERHMTRALWLNEMVMAYMNDDPSWLKHAQEALEKA